METKNLELLRRKLDEIDAGIVDLIAQRQAHVAEIGQAKKHINKPTRDYRREKEVMDGVLAQAATKGLDQKIIQQVFELVIETSLGHQENQKVSQSTLGHNKKALIIGGMGKMGQWFAQFLRTQNFDVFIHDLPTENPPVGFIEDLESCDWEYDFTIVATPIQKSAEILSQLAQIKPSGVVLDISSIKSPLRRPLRQLADAGVPVVSIHPMFGPDAQLLSGKHVIFIEMGNKEAVTTVKQLFDPTMAERIDMKFEDHDRLIAYVLGLSHVLNIAFMTVLAESGEAAAHLAQLSSTTFDAQLGIAQKVANENPSLYFEIQKLNHYSPTTLSALSDTVLRLTDMIHQGNGQAFEQVMQQAKQYFQQ